MLRSPLLTFVLLGERLSTDRARHLHRALMMRVINRIVVVVHVVISLLHGKARVSTTAGERVLHDALRAQGTRA